MPCDLSPDRLSSIDYSALGERLRAYRIAASLQAEDVAKSLGVSRAVVYRMEKGEIVKVETLERLAKLLGTTLASLLGVEVEYHASPISLMERMRQFERDAERVITHFEPISLLLASDDYLPYLKQMLQESFAEQRNALHSGGDIRQMLEILEERRAWFRTRRPNIVSLVGLRNLERFVHTGMVGNLTLPKTVRAERIEAARREVIHIAGLMELEPMNVQIGLVDEAIPPATFQLFQGMERSTLVVSPFRFGELPNVHNGIATVTSSPEAVRLYEQMIERLWSQAEKGKAGAQRLRRLLEQMS